MVLTAPIDRLLTYDDLVSLADDGKRYELIGGEVYETSAPNFLHQWTTHILIRLLSDWVLPLKLGALVAAPFDVRLDVRNIVQPDIIFLASKRLHLLRRSEFKLIDSVPDLLIEMLSPSNRSHDFFKKAALYATFGVREYWIVDAEMGSIFVHVLRDGLFVPLTSEDNIIRSEVLSGFEIDPGGLFVIPAWMSRSTDGETDGA